MIIESKYLILLVLHAASSVLTETFDRLHCKNTTIVCTSPDSQPVCTKLKYPNREVVFVLMAHKCEMQYMKCHDGISAAVVPMKYCQHEALKEKVQIKHRVKRHVFPPKPKTNIERKSGHIKKAQVGKMIKRNSFDRQKAKKANEDAMNEIFNTYAARQLVIDDNDKLSQPTNNFMGKSQIIHPAEVLTKNAEKDRAKSEEDKRDNEEDKRANEEDKRANEEDKRIIEEDKTLEEDAESEDTCPTVCPARKVMLCGMCQHGIYRTFLSVCHLRMFQCKNTKERIRLISRQACVFSAPYLNFFPEPKGVLTEPTDQDDVMQYIHCRSQANSRTNDTATLREKLFGAEKAKCAELEKKYGLTIKNDLERSTQVAEYYTERK